MSANSTQAVNFTEEQDSHVLSVLHTFPFLFLCVGGWGGVGLCVIVCSCPQRPDERVRLPGVRATGGYEQPDWCRKTSLGSLEE